MSLTYFKLIFYYKKLNLYNLRRFSYYIYRLEKVLLITYMHMKFKFKPNGLRHRRCRSTKFLFIINQLHNPRLPYYLYHKQMSPNDKQNLFPLLVVYKYGLKLKCYGFLPKICFPYTMFLDVRNILLKFVLPLYQYFIIVCLMGMFYHAFTFVVRSIFLDSNFISQFIYLGVFKMFKVFEFVDDKESTRLKSHTFCNY